MYQHPIERHAEGDVEGEGEAERHGYIQAGVGLRRCLLHGCGYGDVGRAGGQNGNQQAVAGCDGEEMGCRDREDSVQDGDCNGKHRDEYAVILKCLEPPRRHHTHFEQEDGQEALEDVGGERLDALGTLHIGDDADYQAAGYHDDRAIGERLAQDFFEALLGVAATVATHQHHPNDDGRSLHEGHGRHHVAAIGHLQVFEKQRGGDKRDRTYRTISSGNGPRILDRQPAFQDEERIKWHQHCHSDAQTQRNEDFHI